MRNIHYPFLFIALIISYQISFYLIYRYFKIKDENLGLNKFLPAFGLLYAFGFTGIVIRAINSYYINDSLIYSLLINISHILIFIGTFSFLLIMSQKSFNILLNTKVTKSICVITIIISISVLLSTNILIDGILILLALFIGSFYMLFFHIRLIKKSAGNVKNRILLLFIGEIITIVIATIGAEKNPNFFTTEQQEIVKLLFNPLIILGQIIIFYAIYDFPIFLEFNWQENLLKLYIIDRDNLKILFQFDFTEKKENQTYFKEVDQKVDHHNLIFPGGIIGMEKIFSKITEIKESKLEKIQHGEYIILLKHDEGQLAFITYCLLVKKEMESIKYFIKLINSKFINIYKNILLDLKAIGGKEDLIFIKFHEEIENFIDTK